MIRDPLLNKQALIMYKSYLLGFTIDELIDCKILSFYEWVKENKLFEDDWIED
jgi:hypothetical protein